MPECVATGGEVTTEQEGSTTKHQSSNETLYVQRTCYIHHARQ